jgi:type IX secretion system PorP/SprF family membrane protein
MYRNQWDKVNGAPNSVVLNVEADMTRWFPGGLGISFFHDAIGFNRQNNVMLNYAFPLEIPGAGKLGIGIGVGMMNFSMSPEWVPPTTLNDPTLPSAYSAINVDLNFGIYFKGVQDYYVGISSTHLSESSLVSDANPLNVTTYNTARHYYIMGGKTFNNIGDGAIETNAIIRTDLVKLSADVNARYIWKQKAYGGLTYRVSDAVAVMLGYSPINNFTVGYSYDISINKFSSISRGSHEILVKYCYYLPPIPIQKSKHPRWL